MPDFSVQQDETLDVLCGDSLRLVQKRDGYRFSIDPILLANFVSLRKGESLLDIGTGCGIIPLYMAKRGCRNRLLGIEVQEELYRLAVRNRDLNGCDNVDFVNGEVSDTAKKFADGFQVIVSNPPYYRANAGRRSPVASRCLAREESLLDLPRLLSVAAALLRAKGRLYLIYPAARLAEVVCEGRTRRLEPRRLRLVHPRAGERANLFLLECMKDGGADVKVEPPLCIYAGGTYTDEVRGYYS